MKNKYEIVSSCEISDIQNKINEYLESENAEVFFIGGITNQNGIFCQAILRIPKEKLPVDVPSEPVAFNTEE